MLMDQKCEWMQHVSYKTLPKIGYIAMMGEQPIAVGFLRRVEGGYGQLDTFVTSPWFGSQVRHKGLDGIVNALMAEAKDLNLLGLIAVTKDTGIIKRAKSLGWNEISQTLIGIQLK